MLPVGHWVHLTWCLDCDDWLTPTGRRQTNAFAVRIVRHSTHTDAAPMSFVLDHVESTPTPSDMQLIDLWRDCRLVSSTLSAACVPSNKSNTIRNKYTSTVKRNRIQELQDVYSKAQNQIIYLP